MEFNNVSLDIDGAVAVMTLNRPEALNAVDDAMLEGMADVVAEIRSRGTEVRCFLVTGAGRGFCSGADLVERAKRSGNRLRDAYHPILLEWRDLPMPIVAAVNGPAAGIGMSFALMGDIICASKNAFFLQAFARVGLVPDGGATFMLPRRIGWGRAMELSLLAERLTAERAFEWGLVNRLYDDNDALMKGAMEIADKLASGPKSLGMIRRAYWSTWDSAYEQQLDLEARLQAAASRTHDAAEGSRAFREKRDAKFTGT
ncbi:MAG: enoyl-CoA hydratase-related protein [Gammaproteobacteria bacterium]|nr:enoyl-CoA hydratase-related protein [Gammaproteobacteria bacterium]MDE0226203.1 enoyl-CoA hydratase-related protein [Gammaproteobacteria bacterium]